MTDYPSIDPARASRRSSSRASSSSRRSHPQQVTRAALRARSQKRHSASSNATTTDLTSFPSLSPDLSPEGFSGQPALNRALTNSLLDDDDGDAASETSRGRRSALSKLTSPNPHASTGRAALFGDSILTHDFPGALHLADDSHIERLIATTGAVKLVRQFARDLALRDAEVSALRQRADARERELKRMLREVSVSNQDIERRLYSLENNFHQETRSNIRDGHGKDGATATAGAGVEQSVGSAAAAAATTTASRTGLGGLMEQAMQDDVGSYTHEDDPLHSSELQSTVRVRPSGGNMGSDASSIEPGNNNNNNNDNNNHRKKQTTPRTWSDYILGSGSIQGSRKTSRASSVMSKVGGIEEEEETEHQNQHQNSWLTTSEGVNRRKALDEQLFQPPEVRNGPTESSKRVPDSHNPNFNSRRPGRSLSTLAKLFGGGGNAARTDKDARVASDSRRGRDSYSSAVAAGQDNRNRAVSAASAAPERGNLSAVGSLKRINSNAGVKGMPKRQTANNAASSRASNRRGAAGTISQGGSSDMITGTSSTNLGPVEMDAILPMETRPPTLSQAYKSNNCQPGDLLTDRFGFIYDQRRKKREREAAAVRNSSKRLSGTETLSSFRNDVPDGKGNDNDDDGADANEESQKPLPSLASGSKPSELHTQTTAGPSSENASETGVSGSGSGSGTKRWQDHLKIATRPTELLSHTPSVGPIVSLTTAGEEAPPSSSSRSASMVTFDKGGPVSVPSNAQPSASTSIVVADRPEFAGVSVDEPAAAAAVTAVTVNNVNNVNENEPVRLLLEQLTELHDSLQRERTVRWNEFLRKVRAERRKEAEAASAAAAAGAGGGGIGGGGGGGASDRPLKSVDTPEASLADGEIVGVAGLGNKGKVGRAKWREFRSLVLGGIPVALRAKIWSECSGASTMRVPGYYDDLVRGIGGSEPDSSLVVQIDMDIRRTLTDNVFFREGPGVSKLREVLVAYSRRNPEVGYCQGMNLIAASLLLITPTAEDAFWILASMIEVILPQHYYDHGLRASRADQIVLRQYISQVLPKLSAHLDTLGVELEALTFQWFLSVFTDCLSAEALYRVWDVVLCLNVSSSRNGPSTGRDNNTTTNTNRGDNHNTNDNKNDNSNSMDTSIEDAASGNGGGSTFLFQVALALLKLNEQQLLTTCSTPAALYTYINHQTTNHAISIDGLIEASEALRNVVRREDVVARRTAALKEMQ